MHTNRVHACILLPSLVLLSFIRVSEGVSEESNDCSCIVQCEYCCYHCCSSTLLLIVFLSVARLPSGDINKQQESAPLRLSIRSFYTY